MLKTLAGKHGSTVTKMAAKLQGHHRHPARAAHVLRGQRRTRRQETTGRTVRWDSIAAAEERGPQRPPTRPGQRPAQRAGHPAPSRTVRALRATDGTVEVHHVRKLADLDRPGRPQPAWAQLMAKRRSKTLVVCAACHAAIHAGNQPRHPRSSHWRAGCSESEPVRFGRGSSGRVQPRWHHARRPTSLVGAYKNGGKEYQPQGSPVPTNTHDFIGEAGKAIPYGVYDLGANTGWVYVGTDHETAVFAVKTIRPWWSTIGPSRLPRRRPAADHRRQRRLQRQPTTAWKTELAALATETGLAITVCHLPPGTRSGVAVGTALTGGPPHGSRRAELPHRAPASGSGCEAHVRVGMHHTDLRKPPSCVSAHPRPGDPTALAAPP